MCLHGPSEAPDPSEAGIRSAVMLLDIKEKSKANQTVKRIYILLHPMFRNALP